jgi:3-oxoacyl-[acyl-carrier-protein] synthase II
MTDRTAVVTALGVLSPLGRGPAATWDAALTGRSGVTRAPDGGLVAQVAGPDAPGPVRSADGRPLRGRATALAVTAGCDALAGVDPATVDLVVGTTMGEPSWVDTWPSDEAAQEPVSAERARELLAGTPQGLAAAVAAELGVGGRVAAVGGACAAGNFALARALDDVRSGHSARVLAGGVDAFSRTALMGFARLGALAEDGCRPFGLSRQGLVLGEGAAFLLVEELEAALARGAEPLTELAGAGLSCDAHHPTSPHPEGAGAARAMRAALSDARVGADDVGWVSAHGTGTPANDRAEVLALRSVFTGRRPPASSVKSLSGHSLGAASAIEAVLAVEALRSGCLPPTWGVGAPDPECDWDVMTDGPRPLERDVVLNQAYAFGGCNAVTVFRRAS